MPLSLVPFAGLPAFISEFSLQRNQAAALFARSTRTLRRWRARGSAPQHALDLVTLIREQRAPITPSFARDQRAQLPDWTARLARPRPQSRRRRHLVEIAEAYAANGWTDRAASALAEAWPTASADECQDAAARLVERARGAKASAIERGMSQRRAAHARYMRAWRRRR